VRARTNEKNQNIARTGTRVQRILRMLLSKTLINATKNIMKRQACARSHVRKWEARAQRKQVALDSSANYTTPITSARKLTAEPKRAPMILALLCLCLLAGALCACSWGACAPRDRARRCGRRCRRPLGETSRKAAANSASRRCEPNGEAAARQRRRRAGRSLEKTFLRAQTSGLFTLFSSGNCFARRFCFFSIVQQAAPDRQLPYAKWLRVYYL